MEVAQIGASLGNAVSGVVSAIGNLIPSVGAKGSTGSNQVDFIAPTPNWTDARASGEQDRNFFAAAKDIGVPVTSTAKVPAK
jgi:hypothetical protein